MFGKKNKPIPAMHYEGIDGFQTDYPVQIEVKNSALEIRRIKPETLVTLSLDRINSISAMEESRFMLKYHGHATTTSKAKGINKYYLIVEYDKGYLAFWGTAREYRKFLDLQEIQLTKQIEL